MNKYRERERDRDQCLLVAGSCGRKPGGSKTGHHQKNITFAHLYNCKESSHHTDSDFRLPLHYTYRRRL